MVWSIKNVLVIGVCVLMVAWVFRHEYRTRTIKELTCVERINRFTRERCAPANNVPACMDIMTMPSCDE